MSSLIEWLHSGEIEHEKVLSLSLSLSLLLSTSSPSHAQRPAPQSIADVLRAASGPVEILIEFDAEAANRQADQMAAAAGRVAHGADELAYKRSAFAAAKSAAISGLPGITVTREYENLPMSAVRVDSEAALAAMLARSGVKAAYSPKTYYPVTDSTLPFINQPPVASASVGGDGTTVAVLDTGVDYTRAAFGSCSSPGVPAACRVVATFEAAPDDGVLDSAFLSFHGTNVSGIAAAVAPEANLAVADVFGALGTATNLDLTSAIDWAIGIRATHNIVAMNLSLGDAAVHTSQCSGDSLAPALQNALNNGIQPVIASGNTAYFNSNFDDGVASPACVPAAVSVGAVYDANYGTQSWQVGSAFQCSDSTTAGDRVTCFSQTAPFLSIVSPGTFVSAAGVEQSGTSQATPHVAGAWAVMRAGMPSATGAQILAALQSGGTPVADPRPAGGRTTPRLELFRPLDADADLVLFPLDNCTAVANGSGLGNQVDTDGDGCGNRCDADFNNSALTTIADFNTFKVCFGRSDPPGTPGGPANDPLCLESDMNGSGVITIGDYNDFSLEFSSPSTPGPSGLPGAAPGTACAP